MAFVAAALAVVAGFVLPGATASRNLQVGIYDDAQILGNPDRAFPLLRQLRPEIIRVTMWWGGRADVSVARRKPEEPANPADPAYNWGMYDDVVKRAAENNMRVLLGIQGTPGWANGGKSFNRAPKNAATLRAFAHAAATRYSGTFTPEGAEEPLPAVRYWLAWNEPNDPVFLSPQYRKVRKGKWVMQSPRDYARICNAVVSGVRTTMLRNERIGCGVTSPRGNNKPGSRRASIAPLTFAQAMKAAHARGFDAYAHHPYYGNPSESPAKQPKSGITLANIGQLTKQVNRLFGRKRMWVTEYGYQTKPPDPFFGVSWSRQARYLAQAFSMARKNPAIDMMVWFLIRDEPRARGRDGWQSGLMTTSGRRKPAFNTFRRVSSLMR